MPVPGPYAPDHTAECFDGGLFGVQLVFGGVLGYEVVDTGEVLEEVGGDVGDDADFALEIWEVALEHFVVGMFLRGG